jgi:hypothetical protein
MRAQTRLVALISLVALAAAGVPASRAQERPGVTVERYQLPRAGTAGVGDQIATIVRVDLRRYRLRFLSEVSDGPRRPLPRWMRDESLAGGINAGMFMPDGRSVGYMKSDGEVRSARRPGRVVAVLAADPIAATRSGARMAVGGPGCTPTLRSLDRQYRSVLQARQLLVDCEGSAVRWNNRRGYSSAALGVDEDGAAVFVHVRTPYRMDHLGQMLAAPSLRIRGLVYMEGGPEATLIVDAEGVNVREVGSYEDGFNPNDDNRSFWDLPNVVGFVSR